MVNKLQTLLVSGLENNDEAYLDQVFELNDALGKPLPNFDIEMAKMAAKNLVSMRAKGQTKYGYFYHMFSTFDKKGLVPLPKGYLWNLFTGELLPKLRDHIALNMAETYELAKTANVQTTLKGSQLTVEIQTSQFFILEEHKGFEDLLYKTISMKDISDPKKFQNTVLVSQMQRDLVMFGKNKYIPSYFNRVFKVSVKKHTPYKYKGKYYETKIVLDISFR